MTEGYPDVQDVPPRFEHEFPEEAAFMGRVFAAGGCFPQKPYPPQAVPPVRRIKKWSYCPCGSGLKVLQCHRNWKQHEPGYDLQWNRPTEPKDTI
jgi:hypothetical protein